MAAAGEWPKDVLNALQGFGQGDIVRGTRYYFFGAVTGGLPLDFPDKEAAEVEEAGNGEAGEFDAVEWEISDVGVITSQACDVCEEGPPSQPWVQVSPLRCLPKRFTKTPPDFLYPVQPPTLSKGNWVVDLRMEAPIEKTLLVGQAPESAFATEDELLAFAEALGRRRDRAALSTKLVAAVGQTLREKRRKGGGFKNALRQEVYQVTLNIDDGTRTDPVAVRLHVITNDAPSDRVKNVFGAWWDEACDVCAAAGMKLLPNAYHDRHHTDLQEYAHWIPLDLG